MKHLHHTGLELYRWLARLMVLSTLAATARTALSELRADSRDRAAGDLRPVKIQVSNARQSLPRPDSQSWT